MSEPESIDGYLETLAKLMRGSTEGKDRLLAEVEYHLRESADAEAAEGRSRQEAERLAISRFGSVAVIADRANLAEVVALGRRRLRRIVGHNLIAAAVVLGGVGFFVASDQRTTTAVSMVYVVGACLIAVALYVKQARWGLVPEPLLEAALRREVAAWCQIVRIFRYLVYSEVLFFALWLPWTYSANRVAYRAQPWRAAVGTGGVVVIVALLWWRQVHLKHRADVVSDELGLGVSDGK